MRETETRPTLDIREDLHPMVLLCNVAAGQTSITKLAAERPDEFTPAFQGWERIIR
jgi:hypothetical protein